MYTVYGQLSFMVATGERLLFQEKRLVEGNTQTLLNFLHTLKIIIH